MSLVNLMKQVAVGAMTASDPVALMEGTITKINPLEVFVEQRFTLVADFLMVTESLQELSITVKGVKYLIRRGLQAGDNVLLLREQGGQQYVVLDRVVGK